MNEIAKALIKIYQNNLSGLLGHGKCKFKPTCSEYAYMAYNKYGFVKATIKSLWRILRCNPFSKGGYDPLD